jgi:hypothetical protein
MKSKNPGTSTLFISPVFDIEELHAFVDYLFIPHRNKLMPALLINMEKSLESITKWLMQSDLKINKEKTVLIQQTRWCPHSHQTG